MAPRVLDPTPIFDEAELLEFLAENEAKPVHANTIWRTLLQTGGDFDALKSDSKFPKRLIEPLKSSFAYCTSHVACLEQSALDGTIKLLIRTQTGHEVEAVIINHTGEDINSAPPEKDSVEERMKKTELWQSAENRPLIELRKTLCVSSQIGCKLGCTFCATGTMKLEGNLTSGEIMEQLLLADHVLTVLNSRQGAKSMKIGVEENNAEQSDESQSTEEPEDSPASSKKVKRARSMTTGNYKQQLLNEINGTGSLCAYFGSYISNIVFMGMGEPLENYDGVVSALKGFTSQHRFGLAQRTCTVSTVGIVPKMRQLTVALPNIKLALSLHAPNQKLREKIVPVSRKYPLPELMKVLDEYSERHVTDGKRKGLVMISYVMIDGVNDTKECCYELCELLKGKQVLVNLIPFNEFDPYANSPPRSTRKHMAEDFHPSKPEQITWFADTLIAKAKIKAFERRPHGRDISAACGQLAKIKKNAGGDVFNEVDDIEGLNQRKFINKMVPLSRDVVRSRKREKEAKRCEDLKTAGLIGTAVAGSLAVLGMIYLRSRRGGGN